MRCDRGSRKGARGSAPVTSDGVRFAVAALACAALALAIAARDLASPGLYYDEVIQAEPALWFLRGDLAPPEVPGASHVMLLGHPFPLFTQPYMGALKSQVLVPVLALAGPDVRALRFATLAAAVAGLVLAMAATRMAFDLPTAALLGALLAVDPSFLFTSRHDWGSFALGFVLRNAAALALLTGWRARSRLALFAGGACAGLAVYNKIDAAIPIAAAAAALALASPPLRRELAARRDAWIAALAGALLAASPVLVHALSVLAMARVTARGAVSGAGEWTEKWHAHLAALDGSYFARLLHAGGSFTQMGDVVGAPATFFPALFAVSGAGLALWLARERRGTVWAAQRFAVLAALFTQAGMLLLPHAVRIHHVLNVWPLPQLVVAVAVREAWRRAGAASVALRGALALGFVAALAAAVRIDVQTLDFMRATGGKGLWSDALERLAPELSGARLVALDWGFAGPLRFADPSLRVDEPIWGMRGRHPSALEGDDTSVYLLHERPLAVFPFGAALLDAVAALPVGSARVEPHLDRDGDTAFVTLRFAGPHRLLYRGGRFEVQLR
ncbi:MAG TPA: glycosyltransferase family 39 protein [Myxococcota bacterium]|nr:glycosyltransferase family 39 protein [Myxococcota bacterium]